jgi:hypothetical protein
MLNVMAEETQGQAPTPGAPAGNAAPAAGPAGAAGMPQPNMIPPHVAAMAPRPYPNSQQMFQPVGMALAMQLQMQQQGQPQPPKK